MIVVVLVVFGGSKKIPELARGLGRAAGEFRRGQIEVEREINQLRQKEQPATTSNAGQNTTTTAGSPNASQTTKSSVDERIAALERELEELKKMREREGST